jgi:hypothetical protein
VLSDEAGGRMRPIKIADELARGQQAGTWELIAFEK